MPRKTITEAQIKAFQDTGEEYDLLVADTEVASTLLMIATGQHEATSDNANFILDTEGILSIKRYEKKGQSLPKNEADINAFLGGVEIDVEGLKHRDLLKLFLEIRKNTHNWASVEQEILETAANLDQFSEVMLDKGGKICQLLDEIMYRYPEMEDFDPSRIDDEDYIEEILKELEVDLTDEEKLKAKKVVGLITQLIRNTEKYHDETNNLYVNLLAFDRELKDCEGDVGFRRSLLEKQDVSQEIRERQRKIDEHKERLLRLNQQYSEYVKRSYTGAIGGAVPFFITRSVYGKKAKSTRNEINEIEEEIKKLEDELDKFDRLNSTISMLQSQAQGLTTVMIHAEKGVNELVGVWTGIRKNLEFSKNACEEVKQATDLFWVWLEFEDIVNPWKSVQGNAKLVTKRFNEALDKWEKENR